MERNDSFDAYIPSDGTSFVEPSDVPPIEGDVVRVVLDLPADLFYYIEAITNESLANVHTTIVDALYHQCDVVDDDGSILESIEGTLPPPDDDLFTLYTTGVLPPHQENNNV